MNALQQQAYKILSQYTGFPDIPSGRPCGVWAYTVANVVRRIPAGDEVQPASSHRENDAAENGKMNYISMPFLDTRIDSPAKIFYAAIETDPTGLLVATFPKGAQDLLATRGNERLVVEFGQRRDLLSLLESLRGQAGDGYGGNQPFSSDDTDVQQLHLEVIETLLRQGYDLRMETPFEAAVRETREENGFNLWQSMKHVLRVDMFVEQALSKRRCDVPIEHIIYAAHVSSFTGTTLCHSSITEEKNPDRLGCVYQEYGTFLSLDDMWRKFSAARRIVESMQHGREAAELELRVTESRLEMLGRIERDIYETLPAPLRETLTPPGRAHAFYSQVS